MEFSDEVRKQVSTLMTGINLPQVDADTLIRTALQLASAKMYEGWEKKVKEHDFPGAKAMYAFHEVFGLLYRNYK